MHHLQFYFSAIANELRTMLQEKIVKEEMIFIQPHIKLMCDLLAVLINPNLWTTLNGVHSFIFGP